MKKSIVQTSDSENINESNLLNKNNLLPETSLIRTLFINEPSFDMEKTLTCGQCFRFESRGGKWIGVVERALMVITQSVAGYKIEIYGEDLSDAFISHYFDLDRDYEQLLLELSQVDVHMQNAVSFGRGIRILNQNPFETLISFIISSNNNIPKIKMSIEALAEKFGDPIGVYEGRVYYTFPIKEKLAVASEEALTVKAIGYRAKAVSLTSRAILCENLNLETPYQLNYDEGRTWLKQFYGVGDKVADCILLFAYGKNEAFPVDTWVKKMLGELYGVHKDYEGFIRTYFTAFPGIAQQYLFYYIRNLKN